MREEPAGGGPLAGIAAGLAAVTTEVVCVAAGDTPRAGEVLPELVAALEAGSTVDAAVLSDAAGQPNPLLAAYKVEGLHNGILDRPENKPARTLLALPHVLVRSEVEVLDINTVEDVEQAGNLPAARSQSAVPAPQSPMAPPDARSTSVPSGST